MDRRAGKWRRTALVTGATGFVGSRLVEDLVARSWDVQVVVRRTSNLDNLGASRDRVVVHRHDGTSESLMRIVAESAPSVVFHLAAQVSSRHEPADVAPLLESNVVFPTQLVDAAARHRVPFLVNTATFWQHYGNRAYGPVSLYAAAKQAFQAVLEYYLQTTPLRATTLTLFDTYGPRDPRPKVLSLIRTSSLSGRTLEMTPGEQQLDLVYIKDVTLAYVTAAERLLGGRGRKRENFAVSSGTTISLRDLVDLYERVTGRKVPVLWGGRPYRAREIMVPWSRGRPLPGWSPATGLEEGIRLAEGIPAPDPPGA